MNKNEIMNGVTRAFYGAKFQLKKHSPEILAAAGVVGVVTSAVMACKATTKAQEILKEHERNVEQIQEILEDETISAETYTKEDAEKDLKIYKVQTAAKIVKAYAPAVILGGLSIGSMLASNNILRKRNVGLAAAYAAVDTGFKEYRSRVVERFGQELDKELRHNLKVKEIQKTVTNPETGKEETVTETEVDSAIDLWNGNRSCYAKVYDDGCLGFTDDPETNLTFLRAQMAYANDLLKRRGYVFLNEVYEMLGFPKTKAGQVVGWVYDKDENRVGDNYIDFGIYDTSNASARDFVNKRSKRVILDFNVDGPIMELAEIIEFRNHVNN